MEIKTGLWKKQSKKGNTYYSGKIEIEGKTYENVLRRELL